MTEEKRKEKVREYIAKQKSESQIFKKWLEAAVPEILKLILIDFVKISIKLADDKDSGLPQGVVFSIDHSREYHRATISVYPEAVAMWSNHEFEEIIACMIHELSHMNTSLLANLANARYVSRAEVQESVENLTEVVAKYITRDKERMSNLYQNLHDATKELKVKWES